MGPAHPPVPARCRAQRPACTGTGGPKQAQGRDSQWAQGVPQVPLAQGGRADTGAGEAGPARARGAGRGRARMRASSSVLVATSLLFLLQQLALHRAVALVLLVAQLLLPGQAVLLRGLPAQLPARLVLQLHLRAPAAARPASAPAAPRPDARVARCGLKPPPALPCTPRISHLAALRRATATPLRAVLDHRCRATCGDACMCRGGRQARKGCLQGGAARAP